jgi:drug/metabolite transporter (DMT)-like permease
MSQSATSLLSARLTLVLAAVLWSAGSFFTRVLTADTPFHLDQPRLTPVQIAFWRGIFAGLALLPLLRRIDIRYQPLMPFMVVCFSVMSGLYLSALGLGNAANAILLQNSAPVWVYLIGVYWLGHTPDSRSLRSTILGMIGAATLVVGNWPTNLSGDEQTAQIQILLMGAGSGLTYAGVVLFLNRLKHESAAWLMVLNLLGSALCLGTFVLLRDGVDSFRDWVFAPTPNQLGFLLVFGVFQMALPYWLFARGLKTVSALEAGIITLLEPILNPVWAYLIAPERETPTRWTWIGGGMLLAALVWRYVPARKRDPSPVAEHAP